MATQQLVKMTIQLRRDTAANWELHKDIVPAAGEPCFVIDKNILKIGDGSTQFADLEPINGSKIEVAGDGKTIVLEDGVFKLMGFDAAQVGAQPRKKDDNTIEWVVPVDLTDAVTKLQSDVATINEDVSALQKDSATLLSKIEGLDHKVDGTGEGTVDAKIDAKIDEFANRISDDGTVNTLKELIDYVANHGGELDTIVADIMDLQDRVGDDPVRDQIAYAISTSGHITKEEAESTLLSKVEAAATLKHIKYEISHKPAGTIVDYRDKEIRVMVPADTQWVKQSVGANGNANMYYMGFKAYAPEGAVSFKEDDKATIEDQTMYYFENNDFAGIDKYGRKYSIVWLALASYDEATDTWTYFGKNSSAKKFIGWHYSVEWYDANGVIIASDCIRINLSNEACHSAVEPYYMSNVVKGVKVNGTLLDVVDGIVDIAIAEQTLGVKGSDEIDVAEDGTLSIKSISWSKIAQTEGEDIIFDGGGAAANK